MNRAHTILVLFLSCTPVFSQERKIATSEVNEIITFASIDRPGDLYVVLANGEIIKFDKNGNRIGQIKFSFPPTLFDPGDGTMSFAYIHQGQRLENLSADLSSSRSKQLSEEFAINALLVCPSKNELWIIDSIDVSLKKTKERGTYIAFDIHWTTNEQLLPGDILYMREYQNFLFILVKGKGIRIINNLGQQIKKIERTDITYFNFLGEELYYPRGQSIELLDLYTTEKREMTLPYPVNFALLTDERMILVTGKRIDFFEFKP